MVTSSLDVHFLISSYSHIILDKVLSKIQYNFLEAGQLKKILYCQRQQNQKIKDTYSKAYTILSKSKKESGYP